MLIVFKRKLFTRQICNAVVLMIDFQLSEIKQYFSKIGTNSMKLMTNNRCQKFDSIYIIIHVYKYIRQKCKEQLHGK